MLNPNFSNKPHTFSHDFLLPADEIIELPTDITSKPYEVVKSEISTIEIKMIADKISEKLLKIVEKQLSTVSK